MTSPLQTLKTLFADRPDVVQMLDRRELDLQELTDAELVESYRKKRLYPEPVNLYVTGRTGAGKSSLGNRFLAGSPLPTTGYQDCTSLVQFFRLASNLVYFDLPGCGSSDAYENINRASLLVKQLVSRKLQPTRSVPTLDFTDFITSRQLPNPARTVEIPLAEWESEKCRKLFAPDVILYVVHPHAQWLRPDSDYLIDLLESRKAANLPGNVVFALNLFRNPDGSLKPTEQNVANVRKLITQDWQEVYDGEPTIIEVNALTGAGLQALAEALCRVLPSHKIGNMGEVLTENLRQAARDERSRRFRQLLIGVASRLATFKVDATIGRDGLLQVAFAAICGYGIEVFHEEAAVLAAQREVVGSLAGSAATESRKAREKAISITVKDVEEVVKTEEQVVGHVPVMEQVEEEEVVPTYEVREVRVGRSGAAQAAIGMVEGLIHAAVSPIGLLQNLFGESRTVHDDVSDSFRSAYTWSDRVLEAGTKTVTRLRERLTGFREEKAMVTRLVPQVVLRDQEVGKEYLAGGSRVVEDVLALGLAIERLQPGSDLQAEFEPAVTRARQAVREKLAPLASRIDAAAASPDPSSGEQQLAALLTPAFAQ